MIKLNKYISLRFENRILHDWDMSGLLGVVVLINKLLELRDHIMKYRVFFLFQ
jgi:hypothetical protein